MIKVLKTASILVLVLMLMKIPAQPARAASEDDSAGTVLAARRMAWSDRFTAELKSKNLVYNGDLLSTNNVGRLQVLFRDDSILMMAPDTQTRITEYLWDSGSQGAIGLNLARGVTRVISGKVTEDGGVIKIKTPEAEIGIRGTDVMVKRTPDGTTEIAVLQGELSKPTNVCLPGMQQADCMPLGPQQGALVSATGLKRMDNTRYNNFTSNNLNRDGGVTRPASIQDAAPPQNLAALPSGSLPNQPGNLGAPNYTPQPNPILPTQDSDITATYSGTWNQDYSSGAVGGGTVVSFEGGFDYSIRNIISDPTVSSVNLHATAVTSDSVRHDFGLRGSGDIAKVDKENGSFGFDTTDPSLDGKLTLETPAGFGSSGSPNSSNVIMIPGSPTGDYTQDTLIWGIGSDDYYDYINVQGNPQRTERARTERARPVQRP